MPLFENVRFGEPRELNDRVSVTYHEAGHILGSAFIALDTPGGRLLFTGDIGRPGMPIMDDPATVDHADHLFIDPLWGDSR